MKYVINTEGKTIRPMTGQEDRHERCKKAGCVDALDGSCAFDCEIDPRQCTGLRTTPWAHKPRLRRTC